jgi:NADPH:quinone reductase-like Zn-dependent oxidoreductase
VAGPGQVLLRVRMVCLNHRDLLALSGSYGPRRPENRIPVSDGVGEVLALGAGVQGLTPGQRVVAPHFAGWLNGDWTPAQLGNDLGISQDGWLAEKIVVPAAALVPLPDELSDEQAVAFPAAGLTAWHALVHLGGIKAGDLVLTLGTGGVSIIALQLAKMCGARVAITSSSDEKLAQMRALGADITINYRTQPDWAAALLQASGGVGADIVVETGGLGTLALSINAAAPKGRVVLIGALSNAGAPGLNNLSGIVVKNLKLMGVTSGNRAMLVELVRAAAAHGLKSVVHRSFGFDEAPAAYAYLKSGEHIGKIMIRVG